MYTIVTVVSIIIWEGGSETHTVLFLRSSWYCTM